MSFRAAVKRNLASVARQITPAGARDAVGPVSRSSVPVLRVPDVARTIAWYREQLGVTVECFPTQPPHEFAVVTREQVQLMIRRATDALPPRRAAGWDIYIALGDGEIQKLYDALSATANIVRPLETMPYGALEFEVMDPDGHVLCLGEDAAGEDRQSA